jgi:PhzF family phenazine biosynthesis protein
VLRFKQVDVFTDKPYLGNPVAVVIGAEGLDVATMQRIACWTNLSETTFLLKSDKADYRLRIFTPRQELPFAGHPSIGGAHAALEAGFIEKKSRLRQECLAGVMELTVEQSQIFVHGPRPQLEALGHAQADALTHALGARLSAPMRVQVGPAWLVAEVLDGRLAGLRPDPAHLAALSEALGAVGATIFAPAALPGCAIEVRSFAPAQGIAEDPVCGSGNLAVGAYLRETGQLKRFGESYVAAQGMRVGRDGRVAVCIAEDGIRVGGKCVTCVEGELRVR